MLNAYKSSSESLLSVLLKELIGSQSSVETRSVTSQTEAPPAPLDFSMVSTKSTKSKSKHTSRQRRSHAASGRTSRKSKKLKDVTAIAQNLEIMSSNIDIITNRLVEFRQNSGHEESKSIVGCVGAIMSQLNGCISNFESICRDIKRINESRSRNYDEWMDDLQNSENGRRFLKKLQKSFSRVMSDEKSKIRKEYRGKFDKEKTKLEKLYRKSAVGRVDGKKVDDNRHRNKIVKEIGEIYENTCLMIKSVEEENEQFEQSLELDHRKKVAGIPKNFQVPIKKVKKSQENSKNLNETLISPEESLKKVNLTNKSPERHFKCSSKKFKFVADELKNSGKPQGTSDVNTKPPSKLKISEAKLKLPSFSDSNLNDCRQIHSSTSSSEPSYSSKSFEEDETDDNN